MPALSVRLQSACRAVRNELLARAFEQQVATGSLPPRSRTLRAIYAPTDAEVDGGSVSHSQSLGPFRRLKSFAGHCGADPDGQCAQPDADFTNEGRREAEAAPSPRSKPSKQASKAVSKALALLPDLSRRAPSKTGSTPLRTPLLKPTLPPSVLSPARSPSRMRPTPRSGSAPMPACDTSDVGLPSEKEDPPCKSQGNGGDDCITESLLSPRRRHPSERDGVPPEKSLPSLSSRSVKSQVPL